MFKGTKLIFGAPVALLAPYVGYMLNWIIAWIMDGFSSTAVGYWPPRLFCFDSGVPVAYCGRSPSDLDQFMMVFFFVCCLVGWEAIHTLLPSANDPEQAHRRRWFGSYIVEGMAWSIVVLPTLVLLPHIAITVDSTPGTWGLYGWGGQTLLDFFRSWVLGAAAMFGYALFRRSAIRDL